VLTNLSMIMCSVSPSCSNAYVAMMACSSLSSLAEQSNSKTHSASSGTCRSRGRPPSRKYTFMPDSSTPAHDTERYTARAHKREGRGWTGIELGQESISPPRGATHASHGPGHAAQQETLAKSRFEPGDSSRTQQEARGGSKGASNAAEKMASQRRFRRFSPCCVVEE
jgi:hypothetical protein